INADITGTQAGNANGFGTANPDLSVFFENGSGHTIGGVNPGDRNIMSSGAWAGIYLDGVTNTTIQGNLIGVYADGITASGGQDTGIIVDNSSSIQIGGLVDGAGNVIGGAIDTGIWLQNVNASVVQGNYIGTDVSETYDLGVQDSGLGLSGTSSGNLIGGTAPDAGNVFGYIGTVSNGIGLDSGATGNSLLGNRMFGFNNIPIGFGGAFSSTIPANDNLDTDTGSNDLQNYPIITNVQVNGSDLEITGTFNSLANTTFRLEFFGNRTAGNLGMMADYLGAT
ncbi:MAG: hypothetical protein GY698_21575, partial [Actinomycetia bacterium]|nr:hypothetical protein [Actinomycetes bacterium]